MFFLRNSVDRYQTEDKKQIRHNIELWA